MNIKFLVIIILAYNTYSQSFSDFEIYSRKDSISIYLVAHNKTPANITLKISIKETNQIQQKYIISSLDSLVILKAKTSDKKAYLNQINEKYRLSYHFGDSLTSKHDDKYLYDFPFQKRKRYKLIQAWGGRFSHNNPKSFHALDFKMNIGEPVHAARSGIVVRSIDNFTENGGRELQNNANTIIIKHEDNTFAYYVHLKPEGALVEVGQNIEKGELIGYSGNTGFSTRPHLHLVVRDGNGNSVPVYFKRYKNKKLKVNKTYKK